jgi:Fe-S-cluster containining protein
MPYSKGQVMAHADTLCTDCGLCCNGTFFGSVLVEAAETERLGRVGLRVLQNEGTCTMAQPCAALRGALCDVYADRPSACASYECQLRKRVASGETSLDEAMSAIARARALLAMIRAGLEVPEGGSIWEKILTLEEPTTPEAIALARARYEPTIQAVGELVELGTAAFEPRFSGGGRR